MSDILVLGATGLVGGLVARGLSDRGLAVRRAARAPRGAGWVRFDLTAPKTFAAALVGVERAFLVARPGDDAPHEVAGPLIEAMVGAGVRHVVNLSAMGAELRPDFGLRKVERLLEGSGLAWTHLRPNWFMQIFTVPPIGPALAATGRLALPAGDARLSFVDARDVADVAVEALVDARWVSAGLTLTGPEALDHGAALRALGAGARRPLSYVPTTEDEARADLARAGFDAGRIERLVGFYRLVRAGACAPVTDDVARVLGRPARSFEAFAATHGGGFTTGVLPSEGAGDPGATMAT